MPKALWKPEDVHSSIGGFFDRYKAAAKRAAGIDDGKSHPDYADLADLSPQILIRMQIYRNVTLNSKPEIRNPKQIQMTKIQITETIPPLP